MIITKSKKIKRTGNNRCINCRKKIGLNDSYFRYKLSGRFMCLDCATKRFT